MTDDTLDIFARSPVLRAVQAAIFAECAALMAAVQQVISARMLDNAQGVNLDTLGRIVGLYPRPTIDAGGIVYFAPDSVPGAPDGAGAFVSGAPTAGTVPVDDVRYRALIRAKIAKNHVKHGSAPELMNYALKAFGVPVSVTNAGGGDVNITIRSGDAGVIAAIIGQTTNDQADHIYNMPLPTTARIQRVRVRPPNAFAPDSIPGRPDYGLAEVSYVVNA